MADLASLRARPQQQQDGNFLEALVVAYGIAASIRKPPGKKVANKRKIRIMMITDASGETGAPPFEGDTVEADKSRPSHHGGERRATQASDGDGGASDLEADADRSSGD